MHTQIRDLTDVQHCARTRPKPEPTMLRPEDFHDIIAEQAAQQQVLLMALRRLAALSKAAGQDPAEVRARWKAVGRLAMDKAHFTVAVGHDATVRAEAKSRVEEIIEIGFQ